MHVSMCLISVVQPVSISASVRRNIQKEVETYQTKIERKTATVDTKDPLKLENVCEICNKTKFTEGTGKECKYCKRKACTRCGVQVTIPGTKQVQHFFNIYLYIYL